MDNRDKAAGDTPAAQNDASEIRKPTFWQRYRMPIILGVIAVLLYLGSIVWMVFGRGQVG